MDFNFRARQRLCNFLKRGNGHDERQISQRCEVNLSVERAKTEKERGKSAQRKAERTVEIKSSPDNEKAQ